ncbi:D-2-hydroxyacid dehydrogenase [Cohnella candidum]|uniref:D-2-hydroxyacid dehydrogenase n=1 Tax=Cohnella candidum TaxID=2674991 RepID=A0A3G3K3B6_9BACL|nr:D-2-hydroxyacid dehydrogenase [Cohnella candidum]AYQ74973.1 D-2-hydroxyacid dehydrogenase [Cohnella candidum]
MKTILCLHSLPEDQRELIRREASDCRIIFSPDEPAEERDYREAEIVFGWDRRAKEFLLQGDAKLRWMQSGSSGIDSYPLKQLEDRGVILTDASGVHARSVSETVLAMMLGLSRGIAAAMENKPDGRWESPATMAEMNGSTAAVVGAGQIGRETARLARAFDMKVIGIRRSGGESPEFDETHDLSRLEEALRQADYVVNILPLTDETRHLFDAERFAQMKKGAYFINVGRGASVRTEDLVRALESGHLAGAGLDVFEQEPLPADHPLWRLPNVILTPHNAGGMTERNRERLTQLFVSNLKLYLAGQADALRNLVDYRQQY